MVYSGRFYDIGVQILAMYLRTWIPQIRYYYTVWQILINLELITSGMLKFSLSILKDFINNRNHFCCEEREKLGLDIALILDDSDNDDKSNVLAL